MRVQQYKNLNFSEDLHAITLLAKAQFIKSDRKCPTNSYSAAMAIFFKLSKKYFYCTVGILTKAFPLVYSTVKNLQKTRKPVLFTAHSGQILDRFVLSLKCQRDQVI